MLPPAFHVQSSEQDTPAKARAALLLREAPCNIGGGKLYVGDSKSAVQWAGQHVAYIINCADINYAWHTWCLRFWLNVGYKGKFGELDWGERMMTAVKIVMLALMFGQNVLIHCRQGKHRSGAFCILLLALMWECSVTAALHWYWSKRSDLQNHDWWVLDRIMFRRNDFNGLLERVRQQSWFPKARGNILNRLWAFSVQGPTPVPEHVKEEAQAQAAGAEAEAHAQPRPRPPPKKRPRPPPKKRPRPSSSPSRDQRSASSEGSVRLEPRGSVKLVPRRTSSSPSCSPVPRQTSSSASGILEWVAVRPCGSCGRMPWSCKCRPERRAQLLIAVLPRSASSADPVAEPQVSEALFRRISIRSGVWDDAEAAEHHAAELRDRSRSPSPEDEDKEAWECPSCTSLNSRHKLHCETPTCGLRRPLVQAWRPGDYYCEDCGNHRFRTSRWCNWVHCHSNDWICPACKNLNFAARKTCHTRSCQHPRDWTCPRCALVNWIVRPECKQCQHPRP